MSTSDQLLIIEGSPESDKAFRDAQCNSDYYHSHMRDIWDNNEGQIAFVYDGGKVEMFKDLEDFGTRLEEIPEESRKAGMSFSREAAGAWIL